MKHMGVVGECAFACVCVFVLSNNSLASRQEGGKFRLKDKER